MALIEGVGDEVTLLFSLVFMMLVLALAWLSTRTVDRGEQTLPPTQSTPTDSTEQLDSGCPSCREGSLQSEAGIPEHSTEQQRNGAEGEMDGAERDGALMDRVERAGAERDGAERDGAVRERDGEVKKRDVRVRDGAERERDEDRVERESVRRGAERSKAEGERDEEEGEGVRVGVERETGRDGVVGEGVRDGVEGAQGREGDRRSDGEEGGKQRDRVERKKEGERQSDGVEGERQTDGVEGGGQRAEAERDKQRNGEDGEQRRDKEEGERQRDGDERETDRAEGERQEKEKRSDTERQVVDEREKSPVAGAAADSFPDDVPVEVRQRGSAARVGDDTGVQPPHTDSAQDSSMLMRLKFLNETERIIQVRPEQTIGYIKRTQFPQQEHQVRLIYQGQLLGDDAQTLSSLHITSNCVIHCHISQNATPQSPAGSQAAENTDSTLNIGGLMLPLFFLMLSILWYYQINYRHFFTVPATISLVGITILFSFVAFGAYRR